MLTALTRHKGWMWGFRSVILLYFAVLIVLPVIGVYVHSFSAGWEHFAVSLLDPITWNAVLAFSAGLLLLMEWVKKRKEVH
ncbi:hypothetical protein [Paenibacillus dakarensis]|uniref:hypothetical protein n=1 Tax=Paenibacillus dakarensis TaxID=1527293 RepID=UPI0006D562EF|nr:hypothetical protein [Paenibacillus dakarensis]